jgi:hypothetical protein
LVGIVSRVSGPFAASIVVGNAGATLDGAAADEELVEDAQAEAARARASNSRPPRERIRCTGDSFPTERAVVGLSPPAGFLTPGSTLPRPSQDRRRSAR